MLILRKRHFPAIDFEAQFYAFMVKASFEINFRFTGVRKNEKYAILDSSFDSV